MRNALWALRLASHYRLERARAIKREASRRAEKPMHDVRLKAALRRSRWHLDLRRPLQRIVRANP